jgi:hypothetical protein
LDRIQTNVRVGEADKPLILAIAARLRSDPDFREQLAALLDNRPPDLVEERIKKLEQQVGWLLSGAIVVPSRAAMQFAKLPPAKAALRGAEND